MRLNFITKYFYNLVIRFNVICKENKAVVCRYISLVCYFDNLSSRWSTETLFVLKLSFCMFSHFKIYKPQRGSNLWPRHARHTPGVDALTDRAMTNYKYSCWSVEIMWNLSFLHVTTLSTQFYPECTNRITTADRMV